MAQKAIPSCLACGRLGHSAKTGVLKAAICPIVGSHRWGDVVRARYGGNCGRCGGGNFRYSNGQEFGRNGTRGYMCVPCGAIKPERKG